MTVGGHSDVAFTGTVPAAYDRYLVPLLFEPYAVDLTRRAARLAPANLLEVAAGTGVPSFRHSMPDRETAR